MNAAELGVEQITQAVAEEVARIAARRAKPRLARRDPQHLDVRVRLAAPTATHWMGTDHFGCDVWSRVVYGARAFSRLVTPPLNDSRMVYPRRF